jgi:transposase
MILVPKLPHKVQFVLNFSFPLVKKLCKKTKTEIFVGGRPGYDKEVLFAWLLVKKVTNWDYRTIASMAGVSHPTLIRANELFLRKGVYEKLFVDLVKRAYRKRLIIGKYVAMDSSFVQTFSKKDELGSEGWNDFKDAYGFKLHLLIDCETKFPIALIITNGNAHDGTLAIPLLKKARSWLRKTGYILADKGYDDGDIVNWIVKELEAKAGIPIRKTYKGKNGDKGGNFLNWQLKAKGRSIKKSIYNRRTAVERAFSVLKRTYHLGKEETRGILNFTKNVYLSLISYMLKLFDISKLS